MDAQPRSAAGNLRHLWFEDSDELATLLGHWNAELVRLSGGATGRTSFISGNVGNLGFQSIQAAGRYHLKGGLPPGTVTMAFDLGSEGERRLVGQPIGGNDVIVGRAGAQFDILTAEHHRGFNFALPQALVVEAIGQREPAAESRARNDVLSSITDCDLWTARVRRKVDALLLASDALPAESQALGHACADMSDSLVALLLLPWRRSDSATVRPVWYQRLPIARRVTDFMRANLGEPLMMHDLCGAARASERAVEYAFRDVYGVGPKQYLKMLRLNQVRRDLRTSPGEVASVTSIAHQYGFWHLGHFSAAYRQLFRETPRETRARHAGLPDVATPAQGGDRLVWTQPRGIDT